MSGEQSAPLTDDEWWQISEAAFESISEDLRPTVDRILAQRAAAQTEVSA